MVFAPPACGTRRRGGVRGRGASGQGPVGAAPLSPRRDPSSCSHPPFSSTQLLARREPFVGVGKGNSLATQRAFLVLCCVRLQNSSTRGRVATTRACPRELRRSHTHQPHRTSRVVRADSRAQIFAPPTELPPFPLRQPFVASFVFHSSPGIWIGGSPGGKQLRVHDLWPPALDDFHGMLPESDVSAQGRPRVSS